MPKIFKKNSLNSFIFSQNFNGVGAVKLSETGHFCTAIAFEDGEHSVFLFLNQLQYKNGIYLAAKFFEQFGPSFSDFLSMLYRNYSIKMKGSILPGTNLDLCMETSQLLFDEEDLAIDPHISVYSAMAEAFAKLNTAFSELGYSVNAKIDENFPKYLHADIAVQDILFVLGRLLYLQMKISKYKKVNLSLFCDVAYAQHIFHMTAETDFLENLDRPSELKKWLLDFIPECRLEFIFLNKTGLLTEENFDAKVDRFGNLSLTYTVPYRSPESYYVRSVDKADATFLHVIDNMLESLYAKLKDIDASC